MIQKLIARLPRLARDGQSLTETALFLPIIILLLAGAVEVSNLLVTQNRVTTASRAATGFAAANMRGEDWLSIDPLSGWPAQVAQVARNNVTETLDLDPVRWDVYTVKARLSQNGDFDAVAGGQWDSYHAWGAEQTFSLSAWDAAETVIQQDIIGALEDTDVVPAAGLELVATVAYHDRHSLLGLDAYNLGAFTRVRGLTVMRVDEPNPFVGCPLLPVGIRFNQFSMYPSNWPTDEVIRYLYNGDGSPVYPEDPVGDTQIFPTRMQYPGSSILNYVNMATAPNLNATPFFNNVPGVPLADARPGYLFRARDGNSDDTAGGFGWLTWTGETSEQALLDSLFPPPGNFIEKYPGSDADMNTIQNFDRGVSGNENGVLEVNEWVEGSTGNIHAVDTEMQWYLDNNQPVIIIVYKDYYLTGSNAAYQVAGFVRANVLGFDFGTNDKWIIIEFLGWGDSCEPVT